jgi:TRAP-type C4-dicarboxylate transport system permease large subunit
MDIYSAILVVVPLITPIAAAYGVHPLHLGVIFLANMELGYLTPPMGENLFLSSFRFGRPLSQVYADTLPYCAMLLATVLLITYAPWITMLPIDLLNGG